MAGTVAGFPFVGRDDVLGEIRDVLARAADGHGGLVTLIGAAGAGKTRTAEEVVARADGFRVVWSWCPPGTAGRAFRPWTRLLRELVADDVRCARLMGSSPALRALVSARASVGTPGGTDPEAERLRLADDVAEVLAIVAGHRPLLLGPGRRARRRRLLAAAADGIRGRRPHRPDRAPGHGT